MENILHLYITAGKYEEKNKQEIARTISSRVRRDAAYVLDVEGLKDGFNVENPHALITVNEPINSTSFIVDMGWLLIIESGTGWRRYRTCLLYTSPSPRDKRQSRMPSSA